MKAVTKSISPAGMIRSLAATGSHPRQSTSERFDQDQFLRRAGLGTGDLG
jgi:hypothetical protein